MRKQQKKIQWVGTHESEYHVLAQSCQPGRTYRAVTKFSISCVYCGKVEVFDRQLHRPEIFWQYGKRMLAGGIIKRFCNKGCAVYYRHLPFDWRCTECLAVDCELRTPDGFHKRDTMSGEAQCYDLINKRMNTVIELSCLECPQRVKCEFRDDKIHRSNNRSVCYDYTTQMMDLKCDDCDKVECIIREEGRINPYRRSTGCHTLHNYLLNQQWHQVTCAECNKEDCEFKDDKVHKRIAQAAMCIDYMVKFRLVSCEECKLVDHCEDKDDQLHYASRSRGYIMHSRKFRVNTYVRNMDGIITHVVVNKEQIPVQELLEIEAVEDKIKDKQYFAIDEQCVTKDINKTVQAKVKGLDVQAIDGLEYRNHIPMPVERYMKMLADKHKFVGFDEPGFIEVLTGITKAQVTLGKDIFENELVRRGVKWFVYCKMFVDEDGLSRPFTVCKSGSRLVNQRSDLVFWEINEKNAADKLSVKFLYDRGLEYDTARIMIHPCETEEEAYILELELLQNIGGSLDNDKEELTHEK